MWSKSRQQSVIICLQLVALRRPHSRSGSNFRGPARWIGHPAINGGFMPACTMDADFQLGRECALRDLTIDRGAGQSGALQDSRHADDAFRIGHFWGSECDAAASCGTSMGRAGRSGKWRVGGVAAWRKDTVSSVFCYSHGLYRPRAVNDEGWDNAVILNRLPKRLFLTKADVRTADQPSLASSASVTR